MTLPVTPIDYTSRDYASLRQSMLDYAAQVFPDWTPSSEGDFGVLMVELMAYMGDVLNYYVDRAQFENYLPTATQMQSVMNIAQLLGYTPGSGTPATAVVPLVTASGSGQLNVPVGTQVSTNYLSSIDGPILFEVQGLANSSTDATIVPGPVLVAGTANNTPPVPTYVSVLEGQTVQNADGTPVSLVNSNGLPNQTYKLPQVGVYQSSVTIYVNGSLWQAVDRTISAAANDQVYSLSIDANGYTWITFGDGINGAIPPVNTTISGVYRFGVGASGNVNAGAITSMYTNALAGLSVLMSDPSTSLATAASGGSDPETIDSIRYNAPKAFATAERAITLQDYANIAQAVPGVAFAKATCGYYSSVTVFIIGANGSPASPGLITKVQNSLQSKVLAGVTVTVASAVPVEIVLTDPANVTTTSVLVKVWPTFSHLVVQNAVQQQLLNYFGLANVQMGQTISASDLYFQVMSVPGVMSCSIPLLVRADQAFTGTADITLQSYEFPAPPNVVAPNPIHLTVTATGGL